MTTLSTEQIPGMTEGFGMGFSVFVIHDAGPDSRMGRGPSLCLDDQKKLDDMLRVTQELGTRLHTRKV